MRRAWLRFDPVTLLATLLVGVIPSVLLISVSLLYLTGVSVNLTEQIKEPHRERARACSGALDDEFRAWERALRQAVHQQVVGAERRVTVFPDGGYGGALTGTPGDRAPVERSVDERPFDENSFDEMAFDDWTLISGIDVYLPATPYSLGRTTALDQERAEVLLIALAHARGKQEADSLDALASLPLDLEDPVGFSYAAEAALYAERQLSPQQQRELLLAAPILDSASVAALLTAHSHTLHIPGLPLPLRVQGAGERAPIDGSRVVESELRIAGALPGGAVLECRVPTEPLLSVLLARVEARQTLPSGVYLQLERDGTVVGAIPEGGREWESWPLSAPFHRSWQLSTGTTEDNPLDPLASLGRLKDIHLLWGGLAVLAIGVLGSLCLAAVVSRRVQQSHQRDNFLRLVSHELRTPIASVKMLAETLSLGRVRDDDERQRFLDQMETEIDRLADLVERVLEYGRAGQGKTAAREVVTDPGELVEEVVEQFRQQIGDSSPLTLQTAQQFHPVVLDQEAVKGVVMNLLTNAQKYSPDGAPIEVTVGEESRQLYIRVRDHGQGMRRREQRRIFRPFQRGKHNSRVPGFGLGLAYCKQVATAHRGQIRVWSRVGAGSAFTLEIPLPPRQERPLTES